MRYLGSKSKLLPEIEKIISKYNINGEIFADLFSGTGCVGDYFKGKYKIISNDFLYYSYVINQAKLNYSEPPKFTRFFEEKGMDIFTWLNSRKYCPDETFFIYNNYTPHGKRMFFTTENGIRIDGVRQDIEKLYNERTIDQNEYYFLLASLLNSVTKYSNTSGTYEAFFKFWDSRAKKSFFIEPIEMVSVESLHGENQVFSEDANSLVRKIHGDIAYIDTPYTVTQYVSAYHLLETLALYDSPHITGIGGKRARNNKNSLYAQKSKAAFEFEDLFRQLNFKHIIVSYSNQGLISIDELINIAKLFAKDHKVYIETQYYQEYQNHRSSNKRNGQKLNEVIIYFEKDLSILKSPLNYSGSKNTLMPIITCELPKHIDAFVDVMGGAFNVGINITAMKQVVYNDINFQIVELIKWLMETDKSLIIETIEEIISKYRLSKGNEKAYNKLRADYNNGDRRPSMLFVLHMYSFQNIIRFNKNQQFNTPVGVAGYSADIRNRIFAFNPKTANVHIWNSDFTNIKWEEFPPHTVFYFDPPYNITNAAYNDGKRGGKGWDSKDEIILLQTLDLISRLGYQFILSNTLNHKNRRNDILINWINANGYKVINAGKTGWRYAKQEVLIKNY